MGDLYLYGDKLDSFLKPLRVKAGESLSSLTVSSDYRPYIEYLAPQGNTMELAGLANAAYFEQNRTSVYPKITGIPDEAEDLYVKAMIYYGGKEYRKSLYCIKKAIDIKSSPRLNNLYDAINKKVTEIEEIK